MRYLTVTDDDALTERGETVVARTFLRRSEYTPGGGSGGEVLPPYAASGLPREHSWVSPVYNRGARAVAQIAGQIAAARYAGVDCDLCFIGDSKTEGYEAGSGERWSRSVPGVVRQMLGAVEGFVPAMSPGTDNRWSIANMQAGNSAQIMLMPITPGSPWTATLTYPTAHTGGAFWVHAQTGATIFMKVDNGSTQSFNVPAGNGFHPLTPTVTGTGSHTYAISGNADVRIAGFRPTYAGPRVKVTNLGRGGGRGDYWHPGYSGNQTGLWDVLELADPTAIICQLGTNQRDSSDTNNAIDLKALWEEIATVDVPSVIVAPGGLQVTGSAKGDYPEMYAALWDIADEYDLPLLDFQSVIGDYATADAAGLMFDNPHENAIGYAHEAAAVLALLS